MAALLIHLDTGFVIRALQSGSTEDAELRRWIAQGVRLGVSAIAWSEFLCGPLDAMHTDLIIRFVGEPEPFLAEDAKMAAVFFNQAGRRKGLLADCMIAATAVRLGAFLATTNSQDFRRFSGLMLAPKA